MDIKVFTKAQELPETWDKAVENSPFIKRKYLKLLEETNPCEAKYYLVLSEKPYGFVAYKLKLNIFTYSKYNLKLSITIIGVPASVSAQGYSCDDEEVLMEVLSSIKGIKLILNSDHSLRKLKRAHTLPDCFMKVCWGTMQEYLDSLKNQYRYRYKKIINHGRNLKIRSLGKDESFSEELYKLYENVYLKSNFKLEKLPIDFFRNNGSNTTMFALEGKPVGFIQTFKEEDTFYFLFGGIDYEVNQQNALYFNMLNHIISQGIESGARYIKMGQTAEDAKLRLGCNLEEKYLYLHSSNRVINYLIQYLVPFFGYKYKFPHFHVFK